VKQLQESDTVILGTGYNDARTVTAALVAKLEHSLAGGSLELPSLPEVALKIRRALADENVSVSEIARLLGVSRTAPCSTAAVDRSRA
jgi:hypothetical protein